jgi:hypothetical protein
MFCHKCGNQAAEGSGFCHKCGAKLASGGPIQQAAPVSVSPVTPEPVAPPSPTPTAQNAMPRECHIRFIPKKVFGQWMVRRGTIEVDNLVYTTKFKKPVDFSIQAGTHNLFGYLNYCVKSCKVKTTYLFEPGKQYLIRYKSRFIVFLRGKIKVEEVLQGSQLPKK